MIRRGLRATVASLLVFLLTASALGASPTGFAVADEFQAYYEQSGGLAAFGYALTGPEIEEGRTVQYFERQRFELHEEHRGTPYEVLLGHLGSLDAEQRGLLGDPAFQSLPPDTGSDGHCSFFAETGHRLCGGFRAYWQSTGLNFGDPGVSFRESLALFGYPISEEFTDPDTGLTVQYFERARFEFHPELAGTEHEVLLGLLGEPVMDYLGISSLRRSGLRSIGRRAPAPAPTPVTAPSPTPAPTPAPRPAPPAGTILWSADHETGDVSQWASGQGGEAVFNNGTGQVTVSADVARSGRFSLRLSTNPPAGRADGARIFRWANQQQEAYYSTWLYFPENYTPTAWWNVFQFKSKAPGGSSDSAWILNVGNRGDGRMVFYWYDFIGKRSFGRPLVERTVPAGQWVHVEVYFRASASGDGALTMWQNGEKLYEITGVQTINRPGDVIHFGLASYTDGIRPNPAVVYADDTVISSARVGP